MKKKIIIGSCLAVFILIMLPSVFAVESNTIASTNKSPLFKMLSESNSKVSKSSTTPMILTWIVWLITTGIPAAFIFPWILLVLLFGEPTPSR